MSRSDVPLFEQLPWLAPVDQWHPSAPALVEEARQLSSLVPEDETHGLEIWALLGGMTQADVPKRIKAVYQLMESFQFEESMPGWPVIARSLVRLASSHLPGRYLAAAALLDLVSLALKKDKHRNLLPAEWLEEELDRWSDEVRRVYRSAIRTRLADDARAATYAELWFMDEYWDLAAASERSLSGVPASGDDFFRKFLDHPFAGR